MDYRFGEDYFTVAGYRFGEDLLRDVGSATEYLIDTGMTFEEASRYCNKLHQEFMCKLRASKDRAV